jgi:hypothetical protein
MSAVPFPYLPPIISLSLTYEGVLALTTKQKRAGFKGRVGVTNHNNNKEDDGYDCAEPQTGEHTGPPKMTARNRLHAARGERFSVRGRQSRHENQRCRAGRDAAVRKKTMRRSVCDGEDHMPLCVLKMGPALIHKDYRIGRNDHQGTRFDVSKHSVVWEGKGGRGVYDGFRTVQDIGLDVMNS